jgi:hypothetical protein
MAPNVAAITNARSLASPTISGLKLAFLIAKTLKNLDLIYGFNYINPIIASKHRNMMKRFYRSFGQDIEKCAELGNSDTRFTQNATPVLI